MTYNIQPWSFREEKEWNDRYESVHRVILDLSNETIAEVNLKVSKILIDYFGDFPTVDSMIEDGILEKEAYPIVIPVTEDVLREMELMK